MKNASYIFYNFLIFSFFAHAQMLSASTFTAVFMDEYVGECVSIEIDEVSYTCGSTVFHTNYSNGLEVFWLNFEGSIKVLSIISNQSENKLKNNGEVLIYPHTIFIGAEPHKTFGACTVKNLGQSDMSFWCRLEDNYSGWLNIKFISEVYIPSA